MADFDPDAFVAKAAAPASVFDPDAFVAKAAAAPVRLGQQPLDVGGPSTLGAHFARHLSFGMGDKVTAALQAVQDVAHDKTGRVSLGDAYKRDLAFNDKALESSDEAHPVARWTGNALGVAGSMAVPAGALRALRGAPAATAMATQAAPRLLQLAKSGATSGAALGALGGFGNSRADDAGGTALDVGAGALGGSVLGSLAPLAARGVGRGASYLGDKAQGLAGSLKVRSLKPAPVLGEAMEALPGGREGVGRELLQRRIGGLTKHGTAAQIERALDETGASVDSTARAYDARGGAPLQLSGRVEDTLDRAAELNAEPTTRPAAEHLADVANEYRHAYADPVSATEALAFKRRLGEAAYKAGDQLQRSGDHVAGDFGKGLGGLERGVNSELESAVGPDFTQANLSYRRLLGAGQAAERVAARGHSSHPIGLIPMVAGVGGAAHGAKHGLGAMLAMTLLDKYGSQAGARSLYGVGQGLEAGGGILANYTAPGATETLRESLAPDLSALLQRHPEFATQLAQAQALRQRDDTHNPEAVP